MSPSWEPIENRFAALEGLEAREPRGLEAGRPGARELNRLMDNPGSL